jgi:hypothetical protein
MERKWYYAITGVRHGPITFEELRALVVEGTLKTADLVWQPDFGPEWRTVGQVPELLEPPGLQVPPWVEAEARKVPLLGVTGVCPSCWEAAARACTRVNELLFKPFDITRWFSIGFCAWLAYLGMPSGNFNKIKPGAMKEQADALLEAGVKASAHPGEWMPVVTMLVLGMLFALWLCALRSRGDFMLLHRWYRPDAQIRTCWLASRAAAHELFVWRVFFFFGTLLLFMVDGAFAYLQIIKPYLDAGKVWSATLERPTVTCVTVAVLLVLGMQVVAHLAKAFVVPVMYWNGVTASRAWRVVFELCNQYPLALLAYLVCGAIFWVMAVMAILVFVVCTCCIGIIPLALPYLCGVVLLPVYLFFRGYAVFFLNQWRPELVPATV